MAGTGALGATLYGLVGLPGAGKSTLARVLAPQLDAAIVDRDTIRVRLFPDRQVDAQRDAAANAQMEREIRAHLRAGRNVVADGRSFATCSARSRLAQIAAAGQARLVWLWLDVPAEIAAHRIAADASAHPAADRTPALAGRVERRFERPVAGAIRLDAREPPEELLRQVLAFVRS